jgi:HAD superfamily hydrolase (TIGR01450 family)
MKSWDLNRYAAFFVDVDGVLLRDRHVIDGAIDAFRTLASRGRVLILTNNSTRSRRQHAQLLCELGFEIEADAVIPSAYAAALHLKNRFGLVQAWPVGESGLVEELEACGHRIASSPEDATWVVAGMDRGITYRKLADGLRALEHGARLAATNEDRTYPTPEGAMPGAGSVVGAFRGMGYNPEVSIGKPASVLFDIAMEKAQVDRGRVLMIGDRLETDIEGGVRSGIDTLLVLSGISTQAEIAASGVEPTWVSDSLAEAVSGRVSPGRP